MPRRSARIQGTGRSSSTWPGMLQRSRRHREPGLGNPRSNWAMGKSSKQMGGFPGRHTVFDYDRIMDENGYLQ